jgi:hypothetical protein
MSQKVPNFAAAEDLSRLIRFPWPPGDPIPDIYKILKQEQLIQLVKAEVTFKLNLLRAEQQFYSEVAKMMG